MGFEDMDANRIKTISLLLGHKVNNEIVPISHCGGGLTESNKAIYMNLLRPKVVGKSGRDYLVKPEYVVTVKHSGIIRDSQGNVSSLRAPQFKCPRPDKTVAEVDTIT